jgi:hypothetical protein
MNPDLVLGSYNPTLVAKSRRKLIQDSGIRIRREIISLRPPKSGFFPLPYAILRLN